ncbi:MAG: division/cell wall cluster transcriptional repressor MraZ [Candidatus Velthaea sp.]
MAADRPRFSGFVEHSLDDKGRLVVPARFRERLGAGFFLTIAEPDPCLALYPASTWAEFCDKLEAAPVKDARYRAFIRHLFANTEELSCDSQGRMLVPQSLRAYASIDKDVVSVGTLARIELWGRERYLSQAATLSDLGDMRTEQGLY